jgi:hypothetical protein
VISVSQARAAECVYRTLTYSTAVIENFWVHIWSMPVRNRREPEAIAMAPYLPFDRGGEYGEINGLRGGCGLLGQTSHSRSALCPTVVHMDGLRMAFSHEMVNDAEDGVTGAFLSSGMWLWR